MDESFPERPRLFFGFVFPSGPEYPLLNFWIADSHVPTPKSYVARVQREGSVDCAAEMTTGAIWTQHIWHFCDGEFAARLKLRDAWVMAYEATE